MESLNKAFNSSTNMKNEETLQQRLSTLSERHRNQTVEQATIERNGIQKSLKMVLDDSLATIGKMYIQSQDKPSDPMIAAVLEYSMRNYHSIKNIEKELMNIKVDLPVAPVSTTTLGGQ